MSGIVPCIFKIEHMLARLARRDRLALLGYAAVTILIVLTGEVLAFRFGLAERFGMHPLLLRGGIYATATVGLWAYLLRANRRLVERLMRANLVQYRSILLAYDSAVELKDAYTGGHGRRVAEYAGRIAVMLEMDTAEVETIRQAALLHDLGKIGIPDAILTKPGALTQEETAMIRAHPVKAAHILDDIPALRHLIPAVRHHHERYDGAGYPYGLRGAEILLTARIIAVADVLDALTSDRSYRRALPLQATLAVVRADAGKAFDPDVVRVVMGPEFPRGLETRREAAGVTDGNLRVAV